MTYRENEPVYQDIWEWDIVLLYGRVKLIGHTYAHLDRCVYNQFGAKCQCMMESPKLTSDLVDKNGRPFQDGHLEGQETGEARVLLGVGEGSEVPVLSGKIYRLKGPRKIEGYDSYAPLSIWCVYAEPEPKQGFWASLRERLPWRDGLRETSKFTGNM